MTNLELGVKREILTELGALGRLDIKKHIQVLLHFFQNQNKGLKALNYLSNEQLADLGLERTKLETTFKKSITNESELNHLKRCIHLNGRAWG